MQNSNPQTGAQAPPSKVVHCSNLPVEIREEELVSLASIFGIVEKVLLIGFRGQGFLQMQSLSSATALVTYLVATDTKIRSRRVYGQFSTRSEITAEHLDRKQVPKSPVILVSITNIRADINVDILYQVFCQVGSVHKIIIFERQGLHAFVKMASVEEATKAVVDLDGRSIFRGSCTLSVRYSDYPDVDVKSGNDSRSRDFTRSPMESTVDTSSPNVQFDLSLLTSSDPPLLTNDPCWAYPDPPEEPQTMEMKVEVTCEDLDSGTVVQKECNITVEEPASNILSPPATTTAPSFGPSLTKSWPYTRGGGIHKKVPLLHSDKANSNSPTVLILSNLPEQETTCQRLFMLCGVYGDVLKVKILYNKRDTALVQFNTANQANLAMGHLCNCPFFGKQIIANFSKHHSVYTKNPNDPDDSLSKDFTYSTLHRYKHPGSKNYHNIHPPHSMLHVSRLSDVSEAELLALYSRFGVVHDIRFMDSKKRMALVSLESVSAAVIALVETHDYDIGNSRIRVSFAKMARMCSSLPIRI